MSIGRRWMVQLNGAGGDVSRAGLCDALLPPNGSWMHAMQDVWIPQFDHFNDDDEAEMMLHLPWGANTSGGDMQFDAYLARHESRHPVFWPVIDVSAFVGAMHLFYQRYGKPCWLYMGGIEGSERARWQALSTIDFLGRIKSALAPVMALTQPCRCIVIDTLGVADERFHHKSNQTLESRQFLMYSYICDLLQTRNVGVEPRPILGSPWHRYPECKYIITSQLERCCDETGSNVGGGWCTPSTQLRGEYIILDNGNPAAGRGVQNTFQEVVTWLSQGRSYAVGSDTSWTSSQLAAAAAAKIA